MLRTTVVISNIRKIVPNAGLLRVKMCAAKESRGPTIVLEPLWYSKKASTIKTCMFYYSKLDILRIRKINIASKEKNTKRGLDQYHS